MGNLIRYRAADLPELMDRISKNSIGMDDYFDRFFQMGDINSNYPPYNLVQIDNIKSRLEVALAGFNKKEITVYTEYGKLIVEGKKEDKEEEQYLHRGLAQRSFKRIWSMSEDTEVNNVVFKDGMLVVDLGKVIPEHHARRDYL
tara:strand:+ start:2032 stop:2463 length:432 start_codon:yes stop_codon:yes gene_type:complete